MRTLPASAVRARLGTATRALLRGPGHRRTNHAVLVALGVAFATGVGAIAVGERADRWVVVGHGIAGLAVVLLVPWKSRVIQQAWPRRRLGRWLSLLLALLTVATVATGLLHATGLATRAGGQFMMWWHVAFALALVPLALWHVVARRQRFRRRDLDRRLLLRTGALTATAGGLWLATEGLTRLSGAPGAERRWTGSYRLDRPRPTIWLDDRRPSIDPAGYRLTVVDARGRYELSLAELRQSTTTVRAVIDCTSGWYSEQDWVGVPVTELLREVGGGRGLLVRSATGYWRRFGLDELDPLLLAHTMAGEPLPPSLGAPLRLVAPGRRGFWWVKWVDRIEVEPTPHWWQPPFPLT